VWIEPLAEPDRDRAAARMAHNANREGDHGGAGPPVGDARPGASAADERLRAALAEATVWLTIAMTGDGEGDGS